MRNDRRALVASIMLWGAVSPMHVDAARQGTAQTSPDALTPGTVRVEPLPETRGSASARAAYEEAVAIALGEAGFTMLPGRTGASRYIARIAVSRQVRGEVTSAAPVRGIETRAGNWGAGATVTLPSGKERLRPLVITELTIELVSRADGSTVWRGSALTAQADGTPDDALGVVAAKLADAAMRGFPEVQEAASVP